MLSTRSSSDLRPFEFRLTLREKKCAKRMASKAGISLSELIRRAINAESDKLQLEELREWIQALWEGTVTEQRP